MKGGLEAGRIQFMSLRTSYAGIVLLALLVSACGGGGGGGGQPPPPPQNQTIAFATAGPVAGAVGTTVTNIASGEIVGAEALMRWNSPTRGLVAPDDFIAAAEDSGLIVPLGEWALKQACSVAAGWPPEMRIAVNVSAVQIRSADFARSVISALAVSGVPARRLELEITETVLMDESKTVLKTLRQLRELGVRIALDDFGTGYSSLGYLRRFPVDKIKIDRSFIHDIDNRDTAAIVRTIIGLGAELGITVTAEGVETEAQLDILRKAGCVEAQGFLIGVPSKAADMARLLKSRAAPRPA